MEDPVATKTLILTVRRPLTKQEQVWCCPAPWIRSRCRGLVIEGRLVCGESLWRMDGILKKKYGQEDADHRTEKDRDTVQAFAARGGEEGSGCYGSIAMGYFQIGKWRRRVGCRRNQRGGDREC